MKHLLIVIVLTVCSQFTIAAELSDKKRKVIDELLVITGALEIGEAMGTQATKQFVAAMLQNGQNPDQKLIAIVQDELTTIMREEFIDNGFIRNISYDIYHKHFTLEELQFTLDFYKTPIGAKMAKLLPQVSQEAMMAGQKHGESLQPLVQRRLTARLKAEGYH